MHPILRIALGVAMAQAQMNDPSCKPTKLPGAESGGSSGDGSAAPLSVTARPRCEGCKQEIDPDTCGCSISRELAKACDKAQEALINCILDNHDKPLLPGLDKYTDIAPGDPVDSV